MMKKIINKFLSVCIFLCVGAGIFMRFQMFGMAYEYDELFTAITSDPTLSLSWIWNNWLLVDVHPPLHNVFLWCWNHFVPFGPELWLRLPSLGFGLGALFYAWFAFPKYLGKTARLLFTALLSCNIYLMFYSQHARAYTLILLLSLPVTFYFLDISRRTRRNQTVPLVTWFTFAFCGLLISWSHYFGALAFFLFSGFLLLQGLYYQRPLKFFILIPVVVFLLFLPWLIPNFISQVEFERFAGNWWANQKPEGAPVRDLISFFFTKKIFILIMLMMLAGGVVSLVKYRRIQKPIPFHREILLLTAVLSSAFAVVSFLSNWAYMFIGRYFTSFIPTVFLVFVLVVFPLFRKSVWIKLLFVLFLISNLGIFWKEQQMLLKLPIMSSRLISQIYRDRFSRREMFVIAVEAFPPAAMPAMYGFYANRVYGMGKPVTELFWLNESEREKALLRRKGAFIWMPNCSPNKIKIVEEKWNRKIDVYSQFGTACWLNVSAKKNSPLK